jgi:protein-S-isoprenylcysteine O-methyltransferase Ste14
MPKLHLTPVDIGLIVVYGLLLVSHVLAAWAGNLISLALVLQTGAVIVLLLLHRPATTITGAWTVDTGLGWLGTLMPLLLQVTGDTPWSVWGGPVSYVGTGLSLLAILSLGRSMGMEPANRGIQVAWMYRVVRHPIYATYLLTALGFLLSYPSLLNALILLTWFGVQVARILREETHLGSDPAYEAYRARVRYRLVPFVW